MSSKTRIAVCLLAAGLCAAGSRSPAEDRQVLTVQQFNALKKKWPNYAAVKVPLTVEGRVGLVSRKAIFLKKLSIPFVPQKGKMLPKLPNETRNVTVTAHLERRKRDWVLVVHSVAATPTDEQALRKKSLKLPAEKHEPWYELAEWAFQRATFYNDNGLKEQARKLMETAVGIERLHLKRDDADGRLKLAAKIDELKLSPQLQQELVHEAHQMRWREFLVGGKPEYSAVVAGMKRDLPGFSTALKSVPANLRETYYKSPLPTYKRADAATRKTLHRLLYLQITLHDIEADANADGSNGSKIAGKIEKRVPELRALAATYRERELQYRIGRIGRLQRNDALELIEFVKKQKSAQAATDVVKNWLAAREAEAATALARDLVQLADDYELFLKDRSRAIALLKAAHSKNRDFPGIEKRMSEFGLVLNKDKWDKKTVARKKPIDPVERAIRNGRVLKGMRPEQVRRAMASAPTSILRVVGGRKINEVWIFRQPNNQRMAVHFERLRNQSRQDSKVVAVSSPR